MTKQNHGGDPLAPGGPTESTPSPASGTRTRVRWWVALTVAVPLILLGAVAITGLDRPDAGATAGADLQPGPADGGTEGSDQPQVGDRVPQFTVPTLSGGAFQMPNGTPTILTFIDLCPTCIADTRAVAGLQERFADVAVLAVASDPTADRARLADFVGQAGARDFQLALDPQSTLTTRFDAFSTSGSVLVVDRNGVIVYRGPVEEQAMADALIAAGAQA